MHTHTHLIVRDCRLWILSTKIKIKHALARLLARHSYICSSFVLAGAHNDAILYNWCFDAVAYVRRWACACACIDHGLTFVVRHIDGFPFALISVWFFLLTILTNEGILTIVDTNRFLSFRKFLTNYFLLCNCRFKFDGNATFDQLTSTIYSNQINRLILMSCPTKTVHRLLLLSVCI